ESAAHADRDRLLADVTMHDAINLAGQIIGRGALLEVTDRQHLPQHLALLVGRQVRREADHRRDSSRRVQGFSHDGRRSDIWQPEPRLAEAAEPDTTISPVFSVRAKGFGLSPPTLASEKLRCL